MLEPEKVYSELLAELRHRHDVVWKTRQVFITVALALIVVAARFGELSIGQGVGVVCLLLGATGVMLVIDIRYQRRKMGVLRKLHDLEEHVALDVKWRQGASAERIVHVYIIYAILAVAGTAALFAPVVLDGHWRRLIVR